MNLESFFLSFPFFLFLQILKTENTGILPPPLAWGEGRGGGANNTKLLARVNVCHPHFPA